MKSSKYKQVSLEERERIARSRQAGLSMRAIAEQLGRSPSTISRELARNCVEIDGGYFPHTAHVKASQRARCSGPIEKLLDTALWKVVVTGLRKGWSPEQIAGDLRVRYPDQPEQRVSHETIYLALYAHPRGELKKELLSYLRQHRKQRRPRSRGKDRRGQIANMVSIAERPEDVEDRLIPGHWEGDLIKGAGNRSAVATLVERHSRYVMLVRVEDASARSVCDGLARKFRQVPAMLRKTMTYDRGKEMARHEELSRKTKMHIYFADPHSPWQRGSNENTNGLLRQYLPKGMDLSALSQRELNSIALKLNTRPRKIHNWVTPEQIWNKAIAESVALHP